ncbi:MULTISPECIES: hypothetical protein [unclassified Mesorhizobium]|uniref:hypothetical protein n=1 Tax=unclassified Mesorhizobium TaxID=325217 RepID=UPI001129CB0E|nr:MULTISPECIES: hypothetical protein [unclassified Mesorhizobium]MBZ9701583.1 hypothetical protein [Mesorhizobium sp. CO1-1-3]MBZ9949193.1 hypothetical protein [Mesorhizobium sp. BR1-1-11]TPI99609.1 hypothetical protein FJ428_22005 [Mesorhizobium sp. B2-8-1]
MTNDLKQEILDLLDLVHTLINKDEEERETQRFVLDLDEGWQVLAAWLALRGRMRRRGKHGPSPLPVEALTARQWRHLAKSYVRWVLNEHFSLELHDLAMGGHPFLKPPVDTVSKPDKGDAP